ncbi:hypothetical protein GCM10009608_46110 [Pseudonocardia alaniniphila]
MHNLKGESCDAVLLVAAPPTRGNRQSEAQLWASPLMGRLVETRDEEELRILYVALTRARRYCAIALPDDTPAEILAAFSASGFVEAPQSPVGESTPSPW